MQKLFRSIPQKQIERIFVATHPNPLEPLFKRERERKHLTEDKLLFLDILPSLQRSKTEKRKKYKPEEKKKKNKGFVNEAALTDQLNINENGSWISSAGGSAHESAKRSLELLQLIIDDPPLNRMP